MKAMKKQKRIIQILTGMFLVAFLGLISTYVLQPPLLEKDIPFSLLPRANSFQDLPADLPQYLFDENYVLTLKYPQKVWPREEAQISMTIVRSAWQGFQSQPITDQHQYYYEVKLSLNSAEYMSGDTILEPFRQSQKAFFNWKFLPLVDGAMDGNLWVYFHIINPSTTDDWQLTRFSLPIRVQVIDFLGFSRNNLRVSLIILSVLLALMLITSYYLSRKSRQRAE